MIIEDRELREDIHQTLVVEMGFSNLRAKKWIDVHLDSIINSMYDQVSDYIFKHT